MMEPTVAELEEARNALISLLNKCEKAMLTMRERSARQTLLNRRINALKLAISLMDRQLSSEKSLHK